PLARLSVPPACLHLLRSPQITALSPASSTISPSFFFYCSGPPRDLHSFPTRRSSDLEPVSAVGSGDCFLAGYVAARYEGGTPGRDRKSTRLNSSHVSISYAVFCLKKKKRFEELHAHSPRQSPHYPRHNMMSRSRSRYT